MDLWLTSLLIMLARIVDVSLGTMRTLYVVQGRRWVAFGLGFFEIIIWISVLSKVVNNLSTPAFALAYALGFALGNYVGISIEGTFGKGRRMVRAFTRRGNKLAQHLRELGMVVTQFEGNGKEGPVSMLFLEIDRRHVKEVIEELTAEDPECFYIVDDVRISSGRRVRFHNPTGWRAIQKKK